VFENLLAQDDARSALMADLEGDRLPPAILLSGPPGSGKLTAALEIARVLSCARAEGESPGGAGGLALEKKAQRAAWNCACPACSRHRVLAHPDLLLLGSRSFPEEIPAALELMDRAPGPAVSYFFVRAARKLARRFDAALYEGEDTRLAKAAPLLRELEECLDSIAPEKARAPDKAAPGELAPHAMEAARKAAAAAAKLEACVPDAPPVVMIRNAELWARLAPLGPRKTVIVENADRMLESARNALLKILEEPPESVRFVLLSSRRSAMMTTILSRSRIYQFAGRDAEGTALVIERIFRSSEPAPSVESFLAARRPFPPAVARERATAFLGAALAARPDVGELSEPLASLAREELARQASRGSSALSELFEATKDFGQKDEAYSSSFSSFLAALSAILADLVREDGADAAALALIEGIAALARGAASERASLNRNPSLLAESLMYAIGEVGR
jgi:DNA polymerase III subunit gamma/tau